MAGIDKILNEIKSDAEKEAAEIISAAEKAAEEKKAKAKAQCDEYTAAADEKLARKLEEENKKTESQCEQLEKLKMLKTKQEIIEGVLDKAKERLVNQSDDKYFENIYVLIKKYVQAEDGTLLLNAKDLDRKPADFDKEVTTIAKDCGGTLELSETAADIDGGFIIKYGNIEINASFDAIFEENKDELIDKVNGILFCEGD